MDNVVGRDFRHAFEDSLKVFGEDFHVSGETKRGIFDDRATKRINFPEEFPLKPGDTLLRQLFAATQRAPASLAGFRTFFIAST